MVTISYMQTKKCTTHQEISQKAELDGRSCGSAEKSCSSSNVQNNKSHSFLVHSFSKPSCHRLCWFPSLIFISALSFSSAPHCLFFAPLSAAGLPPCFFQAEAHNKAHHAEAACAAGWRCCTASLPMSSREEEGRRGAGCLIWIGGRGRAKSAREGK